MGRKSEGVAGRRGWAKSARVTGIAVLADELEWQALAEANPLFEFADYPTYLVDVERRMRAAARAGRQVMVGPLMPDQFEARADAAGIARDSPRALKEYERFVADLGPLTEPWLGEPMTKILERLRSHVRAETLQTRAMPALAAAATLHPEPDLAAQRAMSSSAHAFMALVEECGDGQHELLIKVRQQEDGELEYRLPYTRFGKVIAFPDDGGEHMVVVLLALASLAERQGTMLLRSRPEATFFPPRRRPKSRPTGTDASNHGELEKRESTLRGWRLGGRLPQPLSEGQLFALACTGADGDPVPPEPGTRFRAGFPLEPGQFPCCD